MLQEFRDETDAVKAGSLTEVVAVIVSNVIEKLISKLAKQAPVQPWVVSLPICQLLLWL